MKKGVTLVELVVSMAIFLVVMSIAVGAFVTVSRMKGLTSTMKESQQKTRIAMEMITRLARQAEKVIVTNDGKRLDLYFDIKDSTKTSGARFDIAGELLNYYECSGSLNCSDADWGTATSLYEGIALQPESVFIKNGSIPPTLDVTIKGVIGNVAENAYYSDEINLSTTIILENIK